MERIKTCLVAKVKESEELSCRVAKLKSRIGLSWIEETRGTTDAACFTLTLLFVFETRVVSRRIAYAKCARPDLRILISNSPVMKQP